MDFLGAVAGPVRWPLEVHRVESCPAGLPPGDLPPVSHALTPVATAGPALESGKLGSSSSHPLTFPSPHESTAPSATPWDPALEEGPSWPSEADRSESSGSPGSTPLASTRHSPASRPELERKRENHLCLRMTCFYIWSQQNQNEQWKRYCNHEQISEPADYQINTHNTEGLRICKQAQLED